MFRLASSARCLRFIACTASSRNQYSPSHCVVEQREHIQQGRLACARGPHDGDEFAFANFEIDAAQNPGLAGGSFVTAFDILQLNHFSLILRIILLVAKRDHGIDLGGAAGRDVAGG